VVFVISIGVVFFDFNSSGCFLFCDLCDSGSFFSFLRISRFRIRCFVLLAIPIGLFGDVVDTG